MRRGEVRGSDGVRVREVMKEGGVVARRAG